MIKINFCDVSLTKIFLIDRILVTFDFFCITCLKKRICVRAIEICNYCKFYCHDQNCCIAINHIFFVYFYVNAFFFSNVIEKSSKNFRKTFKLIFIFFHDFSNLFIFIKTRFFCFKIIVKFSKRFEHIFRFFFEFLNFFDHFSVSQFHFVRFRIVIVDDLNSFRNVIDEK